MAKKQGVTAVIDANQPQQENNGVSMADPELERQIVAIKAIRDIEIDRLLTQLRLVRSFFNEEQLKTPLLNFIDEKMPNVEVITNSEENQFDIRWKDADGNTQGGDVHGVLLQHFGMNFPSGSSSLRQSFSGFQVPAGMPDGFQTPGAESLRLSIGMTPKTVRLPKQGEMLLSVHGSPLGVYKEDNMEMEAIRESEEEIGGN